MMRKLGLFILIILPMVSCSTKVASIYNASTGGKAKTFMVESVERKEEISDENIALDKLLHAIIERELTTKGLSSSMLPDLYVSYLISVHTSTDTQSDYDYYNPYRYNYNAYNSPYYNSYNTRTYKKGVLIIDIKNARDKLVWQGSKEFRLKSKQGMPDVVSEICADVIQVFDPKH